MNTDLSNSTPVTWQQQPQMPPSMKDNYLVQRSVVQPSVLIGGPTPEPLNAAGVNDSGRIETYVSVPIIFPLFATNKYANRTQIQAAVGITVQVTVSDPRFVAQDQATIAAGGTNLQCIWSTVTLTSGYAEINGSLSGIYFSAGTGHVTVVKQ